MRRIVPFCIVLILLFENGFAQSESNSSGFSFNHWKEEGRPWVFWYWYKGQISAKGIRFDICAMKEAGLEGAYLMTISSGEDKSAINQLSPQWWGLIDLAFHVADSCGIKLAIHTADGFATAGGPWITPENSMQKLVWTKTFVKGSTFFRDSLAVPEVRENYYRDIAIIAYPSLPDEWRSSFQYHPGITCSDSLKDIGFLNTDQHEKEFSSDHDCWITYSFKHPFTCRSLIIGGSRNKYAGSYQAQRICVQCSDDGIHFRTIIQLIPARHGWEDWDATITRSIPETTSRWFRFLWSSDGSEPGAEDLDGAKWNPRLKLTSLELSGSPVIDQYEAKNASVWRVGQPGDTTAYSVKMNSICNLTDSLGANGKLSWHVPEGNWTILRLGHTSTGFKNETGGGGKGLECDKLDSKSVQLQLNNWFKNIYRRVDGTLNPVKILHLDSWECASQNWTRLMPEEFFKRRHYSIQMFLPVLAGIPVENYQRSVCFLHDFRQTVDDLLSENCFGTIAAQAHQLGLEFSAESVAPVFDCDNLSHNRFVDIPMGEFWLDSPTHDKPNDVLDAISSGHIYGKRIIGSEAFTELRIRWNETPASLKTLGDLNLAKGVNRLVFHVMMENPNPLEKPGITLGGVGLLFQPSQSWWSSIRGWMDYWARCQSLLQQGDPIVDVAVFAGENIPSRAVLPERLFSTLPGPAGENKLLAAKNKFLNQSCPMAKSPAGVAYSANMTLANDYINPLPGYQYDSFSRDALLNEAKVKNGKVYFRGNTAYSVIVVPKSRLMNPDGKAMSCAVAKALLDLVRQGATVILGAIPDHVPGASGDSLENKRLQKIMEAFSLKDAIATNDSVSWKNIGKGKVIFGPLKKEFNEEPIELTPDLVISGKPLTDSVIAWNHRRCQNQDLYFISNQSDQSGKVNLSFRVSGSIPEIYNPETSQFEQAEKYSQENNRTFVTLKMGSRESLFILFGDSAKNEYKISLASGLKWCQPIECQWKLSFNSVWGGPQNPVFIDSLKSWTSFNNPKMKYYSGPVTYEIGFKWNNKISKSHQYWLDIPEVHDVAAVYLNGKDCGLIWTYPQKVLISEALRKGNNTLKIVVSNSWNNRVFAEKGNLIEPSFFKTNVSIKHNYIAKGLLSAGITGKVEIIETNN